MKYPPKGYLSIRSTYQYFDQSLYNNFYLHFFVLVRFIGIIGEDDYYVPNIIFGTDYESFLMFYRCHKKIEGKSYNNLSFILRV